MAVALRCLLDTNICIHLLKGSDRRVDARMRLNAPGEVGVAASTVFELSYGAAKSAQPERNRAALAAFFLPLVLLPFDTAAAAHAGAIRAHLERAGTPIGPNDLLIAAHALALGGPLVTNNEREFRRVPGLIVDNWAR